MSKRLRIKITSNLLVLFALGCAGAGVYLFVTPVPTREEAFQKLRSQVFDHWEAERSSLPTMSWHCNYTSIFPIEISKNTTIQNTTLIGNNTPLVESTEYGWPELLYNQKNSDAPKLSPLKLSSNFTLPKNWDNSTGNRANMTCDYKGASGLHGRYTAEFPYILTKSVGFVELNCRLGPCERSSDTVCQNQPLCTDVCKAGEWNFGQESCVMTYHLHAVCLRAVKMNDVYDIDEDAHPCFNIAPDWFAFNATTTGHPIVQYYANSEAWYRRNASGDFVFEVRENSDPIFWIAENTQSTFTFDRTIVSVLASSIKCQ
ncbi:hypothetical protein BKA69DRAFT_280952 [Paraphysoderma sedebokerense]|nr:hypothetical protein BKA69DRAFT_280952 [Paraphysoderma sedebokerense]